MDVVDVLCKPGLVCKPPIAAEHFAGKTDRVACTAADGLV